MIDVSRDGGHRKIGPRPFSPTDNGFAFVQLRRSNDDADRPAPLQLKVEFNVMLDDAAEHLTVYKSAFGVWLLPDNRTKPSPVVRIEYERNSRSKPSAHVHLHAESVELGWLYGRAGRNLPRVQEIHYPMGGRRFRPTIEDLLLFLDEEGLYSDWRPGWREAVQRSLERWEHRQARATARRNPAAVIEELEELGYTVTREA